MKSYEVIKEGREYTIAEYDKGYKAYIINDGIYGYYYWTSQGAAQKAADAYNTYEGSEWLWQHGYGNNRITADEIEDMPEDMVALYRLFGAVEGGAQSEI